MRESKAQSGQPDLEEQFRLMVESVKDYAIYMLDPHYLARLVRDSG